jgi:hemerythrin superfamily protein
MAYGDQTNIHGTSTTRRTTLHVRDNGTGAARSGGNGKLWGAVAAGVAVGLAANMGRKLAVQATSGLSGDWFEVLKTEHRMALAIFDKIEATSDDQKARRTMLLTQLKHALSKHAIEEEDVIYPELRLADQSTAADKLNHDHGYIKHYLYKLLNTPKDSPEWLGIVREFRTLVEEHVREEEEEIYPSFRAKMSQEQNAKLTTLVNKEGLSLA